MKKWISMLLVILMLCSLCASSWAEEEELPNETEAVAYAGCGVAFTLPEGMRNLRGTLVHENTSVVDGIFCTELFYFAMPRERYEQLAQKVLVDQAGTDEEIGEYFGSGCSVCSVYCVDGGRDFGAVTDAYRELLDTDPGLDGEKAVKLAQIGEYSFYLYKAHEPEQAAELVSDAYAGELAGVLSGIDELVEDMVFTKPATLLAEKYAPAVKLLEQIDGAAPALETENEAAETDAEEAAPPEEAAAEPVEEAAEAVAEEPVNEPAEPAEEAPAPVEETAFEPAAEEAAAEETAPIEETAPAEEAAEEEKLSGPVPNDLRVYRVFVRDDEGPVEGVTVQFCSDTACLIGKTKADGCTSFDQPAGLVYTVHILKTPKGYEKDTAEYETLNVYSDLEIVIARTAE